MTELEKIIKQLPPELQDEVKEFAKSLLARKRKVRGKPEFKWAGILKELRDQWTSVELQHQIARWRAGEK